MSKIKATRVGIMQANPLLQITNFAIFSSQIKNISFWVKII